MPRITAVIVAVALAGGCAHGTSQDDHKEAAMAEPLYTATVYTAPGLFPKGIEGPAVDRNGVLYAVNFARPGTIGMVRPGAEPELYVELPAGSTANGIRIRRDGSLMLADYTGHNVLRIDPATRAVTVHGHNAAMNQPNDLALTEDDIIFASDPSWANSTGNLWRIDPDGTSHLLEADMGTTNGIEVAPGDKRLYVNESVQRRIWVYDLAPGGIVSNKRLLIEFSDHGLDGMRCDVDGNLYVTRYGGGHVAKISPSGEVIRTIPLTGQRPTNIAFGGPDGCTAYVTIQDNGNIETFRVERPGREWVMVNR
jgi:sugar lactone lactonase YvrE